MNLPKSMKAAAIDRFGPPSVLTIHVVPVPAVGPSEVLIALHAAGVGIWDAQIRDGSWAVGPKRFPRVLGTDGAGIVVAKGARVRRFDVGDRVWAFDYENPKGGFYAEYVAVDAAHVGRAPTRLSMPEAAAGCVTGLTALQGIDDWLEVRRGDTVLVFGGTGAVGTLAVQLAKRRGARVIATGSGRDAARLLRGLGADTVIDARDRDELAQLPELAPEGLDAVLATAGGPALERCLDLVADGGRLAYPNGVEPEPRRRAKVPLSAYDAECNPRELARLARAVTDARLRVPIAARYPLAQAARAHGRLEQGHVLGRIALLIRRGHR